MTVLTAANRAKLRTRPHLTTLWLSAFQPTTVLAAQVNDASIDKGARSITYDTVSSGSYTNIEADFVCLVGSTPGASDIGRIRVRSATSSVLTVAENMDIAWADDLYLTIIKYIDIVPVFPRIIQDPSNPENVIFYKDYDIAYTNQNSVLGSFTCMTNHKAGFRSTNSGEEVISEGTYQAYWTATGTYNVKGETLQYLWEFEGGSPSAYTGLEPGYVSYSSPGHYQTKLTVSGTSAVDVSYRYVSVYDRPGEGASTPILKWQLEELTGSRDGAGWSAKIRVYDDVSTIQANTLIVIFADEWYGSNNISFGGNAKNNGAIKFVGYVIDGSITYNWQQGYVEFEVQTPTGLMSKKQGFSVSCSSKASPATWFEILDMTVSRALYHYLRWHSTVLKVCDFQYLETDYFVQYFDADRESLYDAVGNFIRDGLDGEVVCDMQGKIWVEISAGATQNAQTAFPVALNMDKQDWIGEPNVDIRLMNEISYVERGGIAFSGLSSGTFRAMMSGAPGQTPAYAGTPDRKQGLILTTQAALNRTTGNIFAYRNSKYPDIEFAMSGNYSNLDIAPIQRIGVNISQTDTPKGIILQNSPFHPTRISWEYDTHNKSFVPTMSVAQLVNGVAGETIAIPPVPPNGGFRNPPIIIPNIPPLIIPDFNFNVGAQGYATLAYDFGANPDVTNLYAISWQIIPNPTGYNLGAFLTFPFGGNYTKVGFGLPGIYLITCQGVWSGTTLHGISFSSSGGTIHSYSYQPEGWAAGIAPFNEITPNISFLFYADAGANFSIVASDLVSTMDNADLHIVKLS